MNGVVGRTEQESKLVLALGGLLVVMAVGAIQHATPSHVSYTSVYLFLTGAMAYLGGWVPGMVAALGSAGLVLGKEWIWGDSLIPTSTALFNFVSRLGSFVGVVWIVERWRQSARELERGVMMRTAELRRQIAEQQVTEGRLRESMERFSQLAENISEVFWLRDAHEWNLVYVSPAYERIWGRSCASLYAAPRSWMALVHPEDQPRVTRELPRQIEGGYSQEYRIVHPDGTQRWIHDRAFPIRGKTGEVVRIAGIAQDITERKETEDRLKLQARVLEKMAEGVVLAGPDYRIRFTNSALDAMLNCKAGELIGQSWEILRADPPEEIARRTAEMAGSVRERGIWSGELRLRRKDGGVVVAETRISGLLLDGQPHFVGVCQDVTARRRAEQRLAETLDLNQKITAASSVGIAAYRASGRCVWANDAAARIVGGSTEKMLERNFFEIDSWKKSGLLSFAQEVLRREQPAAGEFHMVTTFGKELWLAVRATTFVRGGELHLLTMVEDVTERKRSAALLELQRDVSRTLSSMNNLRAAFDYLLDVVTRLDGIDCGSVHLVESRTGELQLVASCGLSPGFVRRISLLGADSQQAVQAKAGRPIYGRPGDIARLFAADCEREGITAMGMLPMRRDPGLVAALVVATHEQDEIPVPARLALETIAGLAQGAFGRIQAGEERRRAEARLRSFIAGAPIVLFAADRDGFITFEDGRALDALGAAPGQHVGQSVAEVRGCLPFALEPVQCALRGETIGAIAEVSGLAFDCRYSPVRDEAGQCTGCIGVATDITERVRLEREIIEISDREQARLGQDIHDGLCQHLVSIAFDANSLAQRLTEEAHSESQRAERIALFLDDVITDSRRLARGLYPVKLEVEGLTSALQELADTTQSRFSIQCEVLTQATFVPRNKAAAIHLYRIAQEAVNNAVKHSHAHRLLIRLSASNQDLQLEVSDDGQGFELSPGPSAGMGLRIMDYRARALGGSLRVARQPEGGTVVSCCVPLEKI